MKPVTINLVKKKDIRGKLLLGCVAVFVITTLTLTLVNSYDYLENAKVINEYKQRIQTLNQRRTAKIALARDTGGEKKEQAALKEQKNYLSGLIQKNMFPFSGILGRLERLKPDQVNLQRIEFNNDMNVIVINGESDYVGAVSDFLVGMDRSDYFSIEISKKEIGRDKKIKFKLTARWTGGTNEKEI